jgi:hypothetical protein
MIKAAFSKPRDREPTLDTGTRAGLRSPAGPDRIRSGSRNIKASMELRSHDPVTRPASDTRPGGTKPAAPAQRDTNAFEYLS